MDKLGNQCLSSCRVNLDVGVTEQVERHNAALVDKSKRFWCNLKNGANQGHARILIAILFCNYLMKNRRLQSRG